MANTYTLISSNTLSSATASVTFSSISSSYDDLLIRISARTDAASISDGIKIQINGDTATNYSARSLTSLGTVASIANYGFANQTASNFPRSINGDSATSSIFGSWEGYIPQYANSSTNPISIFGVGENNATSAAMGIGAGLYQNGSGISSITITNGNNANFMTGSSFYIYGIKNS